MNRSAWVFLAFSVLSIGATLLTTGLQQKAYNKQNEHINSAIDEAEKDMGIYDEETARSTPAMKRALNMSREMRDRAEENRMLLDSLTRADREALRDYTYVDSTESE